MFSAKPLMAALALGAATIAIATPQAAQAGVVVASSGPSSATYPAGKKLKDTDRITLRAGDSVTVLDSRGTRVISGAGTHVVGARGTSRASTFASLTRRNSGRRARTGAVRSGRTSGPSTPAANIWNVDVSQGGNVCMTDLSSINLRRPGTQGQSTYRVSSADSTEHLHVTFEDGKADSALDTTRLAITAGESYMISGPNGAAPVMITFTMLDGAANEPEGLASGLIANGCTTQLELLSSTMMTS